MDSQTFIKQFRFTGPNGWATGDDIDKIRLFLDHNPDSARLWNFCGDAIHTIGSDSGRYSLDDARKCYEAAVSRYPDDPEGYESLGFWHDIHNNFELAESFFRKAIERGKSDTPVLGLARVLAQMGRTSEGLTVLATCSNPHSGEANSLRTEIKNGSWSPGD